MAINKDKGLYVQTLLDKPLNELLERFSTISGYSKSFIIKTILSVYLPLEVEKFCNIKEAKYET